MDIITQKPHCRCCGSTDIGIIGGDEGDSACCNDDILWDCRDGLCTHQAGDVHRATVEGLLQDGYDKFEALRLADEAAEALQMEYEKVYDS